MVRRKGEMLGRKMLRRERGKWFCSEKGGKGAGPEKGEDRAVVEGEGGGRRDLVVCLCMSCKRTAH